MSNGRTFKLTDFTTLSGYRLPPDERRSRPTADDLPQIQPLDLAAALGPYERTPTDRHAYDDDQRGMIADWARRLEVEDTPKPTGVLKG